MRSRAAWRSDEGIIVNWLLRLMLILLILGLIVYEAGVVIYANIQTSEIASKAADEANFVYRDTRDRAEAEEAARFIAAQLGAEFVEEEYLLDVRARTVTVSVRREAPTLYIHRIGPLRKYTIITATETKPFPS